MAKAVILDMDGVIVDSEGIRKEVLTLLGKEFGYRMSSEDWKAIRGRTTKDVCAFLISKYSPKTPYKEFVRKKNELLGSRMHCIKLFSGFEKLMRGLRGCKVAIATSSTRRNAEAILSMCGIRKHFKLIVTGSEVKHGKPHPEPFLKAAKMLEFQPEECVVVEDSPSGVKAGKAAGMKVIAVTTSHRNEDLKGADIIVKDIGAITRKMLEEL